MEDKDIKFDEWVENRFGQSYCPQANHLTFEKLPAESLFDREYQTLFEQKDYLFIVVGSDSGLFYKYIAEKSLENNLSFIFLDYESVIEHSPNIDQSVEHGSKLAIHSRDYHFIQLLERHSSYIMRRQVMLIKSFAVLDAAPGSPYAKLWTEIESRFNTFIRSEYNAQNAKVFELERLRNAPENMIPIVTLDRMLEGRDAIVLGGGPTLDETMDWVKQNQSKLVIFAAARIAGRMANEGIVPDFFVTVDPFPWSFDNAKGVLAFAEQSVLLTSFHAQHRLVSQWYGAHAYAGERYAWHHDYEPNIDAPGPTVTNAALHIAASLGAKRVFLSGIDFCFAGGKTHESQSAEAKANDLYAYQKTIRVEDNSGNLAETEPAFFNSINAMQYAVSIYKAQREIEVISLGSLSAKMDGVEYRHYDSIELDSTEKTELMLSVHEKLTLDVKAKLALLKATEKEFQTQLKRFKELNKFAKDALKAIPKVYDSNTQALNAKAGEKISRLKKKVTKLVAEDGDMLVTYQSAFFADSFKEVSDEKNMTQDEVVDQLNAFFKGIRLSSEHFAQAIESGIKRIKLRIDEMNPKSKMCDLVEAWSKTKEYGRVLHWQGFFADKKLDATDQACLDKVLKLFEDELGETNHQYSEMLSKNVSNVATLYHRADLAYENKNMDEIQGILDHANSLDALDKSQKNSFINFLNAMLLELQGEKEQAVDYYLMVEMPFFRRIALNKVLNIKIAQQEYEQALLVLEALCGFSLDFMVPYADMLNLLGNTPLAIEVLQLYINQKPKSVDARLKLAQLYMDRADFQQAKQVLQDLLAVDEENKAALHLLKQCD